MIRAIKKNCTQSLLHFIIVWACANKVDKKFGEQLASADAQLNFHITQVNTQGRKRQKYMELPFLFTAVQGGAQEFTKSTS